MKAHLHCQSLGHSHSHCVYHNQKNPYKGCVCVLNLCHLSADVVFTMIHLAAMVTTDDSVTVDNAVSLTHSSPVRVTFTGILFYVFCVCGIYFRLWNATVAVLLWLLATQNTLSKTWMSSFFKVAPHLGWLKHEFKVSDVWFLLQHSSISSPLDFFHWKASGFHRSTLYLSYAAMRAKVWCLSRCTSALS